jgi:peptide/nickel transport system permease protein
MISLRSYFSRFANILGLLIVLGIVAVAIAAPKIAPPDNPDDPALFRQVGLSSSVPKPPGEDLILGTVPGSLDVFYTLIWGTRSALRVGLLTTICTSFIGILIGAISGYSSWRVNSILMRITDAFLAFPSVAGVAVFAQLITPGPGFDTSMSPFQLFLIQVGFDPIILALILFSWMPYARVINANILKSKENEYIHAARALGAGRMRVIFKHLLPNSMSPAIVLMARDVGGMVLLAAGFSYIGFFGGSAWGRILVNSRGWIIGPAGNPFAYWWTFAPFTVALLLFGIGWNLLGDGLNIVLNPHLAQMYRITTVGQSIRQLVRRLFSRNSNLPTGPITID